SPRDIRHSHRQPFTLSPRRAHHRRKKAHPRKRPDRHSRAQHGHLPALLNPRHLRRKKPERQRHRVQRCHYHPSQITPPRRRPTPSQCYPFPKYPDSHPHHSLSPASFVNPHLGPFFSWRSGSSFPSTPAPPHHPAPPQSNPHRPPSPNLQSVNPLPHPRSSP